MARRRRRGGLKLDPGLLHILGQVAPGGHLQKAGPITSDFEPDLPDNPWTPHVAPSAASRASWYRTVVPPLPPLLSDSGDQAIVPTMPQLQLTASQQARTITPQQAYKAALENPWETKLHPETFTGFYKSPEVAQRAENIAEQGRTKALGESEGGNWTEDLTNLALLIGGGAGIRAFKTAAGAGEGLLGAGEATTAAGEVTEATKIAKAAQGFGRVVSAPIRHPFATAASPVAAEVPAAVRSGNPEQLLHGFAGTGVLAAALHGVGGGVQGAIPGVLGAALRDAVELPAQVLPSTYLGLEAGLEAAQGDPEHLQELQKGFADESALGQLLIHHSPQGALEAAVRHPLYAGLEAAGLKSVAGHGITGLQRVAGVDSAAKGLLRPDLNIYGEVNQQRGPYSRDYFARRYQQRSDRSNPWAREPGTRGATDPGAIPATNRQIDSYLRSVTDRQIYGGEQARRGNQRTGQAALLEAAPKSKAQRRVANLQLQGLISADPKVAVLDMENMRRDLIAQQPHLTPSEMKVNKQLVRDLKRAIDEGPLDTSALVDTFHALQEPVESGLIAAKQLDPQQAAERIASPYAYQYMDATRGLSKENLAKLEEVRQELGTNPKAIGKLSELRAKEQRLGPEGEPLTLEEIHAHMRDPELGPGFVDPDRLGYVNQQRASLEGEPAPPSTSYAPPGEYAQIANKKFTGAATKRGTFDASIEGLINSWKGQRTVVDRLANFSRFVNRVGIKDPDGRAFKNSTEARYFIEHPEDFRTADGRQVELPAVPGGWVPIRTAPWLGKKELAEAQGDVGQNRAIAGEAYPDQAMVDKAEGGEMLADTMAEALQAGDGPVVLVPKAVADRMNSHFAKMLPAEKAMQAITGAFKGAVLPTSVTWLAGNTIDNLLIRTLGTGITPGDILAGKRLGKLMEEGLSERDATYAIESINSGGIFGTHKRIQPHRDARQFAGTRLGPLTEAMHKLLGTPGPREVHRAYTAYRDAVFAFDSKFVEQTGQWGQLSKTARKELGMTRRQFKRAIKAQEPVLMDLVRGFRDPDKVDHYAREVEKVFGNWGKNSPEARRFLTTWAPFWQWARAATKFAFVTLPRDHPMLTALLAAGEQMTRQEREALGFSFEGPEPLPGWLQGSIPDPMNPGGVSRLSNLTTFGSFGNPVQFYAQNVAPTVFQGFALAGLGLDWKGDRITKDDGTPAGPLELAMAGLWGTVDSFIPFLNVGKGLVEKGAGQTLNPIRSYSPESVASQREPRQEISVPVTGSSSSSSSNPWDSSSESSSNPWDVSSSSSANPWSR